MAFEALLVPPDDAVNLVDHLWRQARIGGRANQGVRLASPSLAVGKDCGVVAIKRRLHQILAILEHLLLGPWAEHRVEHELAHVLAIPSAADAALGAGVYFKRQAIDRAGRWSVPLLDFLLAHRAHATEYPNRALQVLGHVVKAPPVILSLDERGLGDSVLLGVSDGLTEPLLCLAERRHTLWVHSLDSSQDAVHTGLRQFPGPAHCPFKLILRQPTVTGGLNRHADRLSAIVQRLDFSV
mmetsp:Transcript_69634/g.193809  ORF Transcript_69634/g.193809 Transcript_69634/m.193809 type:complete len:240 (+) Transcript_69634:412-1131(+)